MSKKQHLKPSGKVRLTAAKRQQVMRLLENPEIRHAITGGRNDVDAEECFLPLLLLFGLWGGTRAARRGFAGRGLGSGLGFGGRGFGGRGFGGLGGGYGGGTWGGPTGGLYGAGPMQRGSMGNFGGYGGYSPYGGFGTGGFGGGFPFMF
ncbi:hypothetical protein [Alicyclobacillus mengziensis]|uniref:hypothetical protein n=1 Tax=Alicyclobacillus mengziensis TaxID=2931921 RepID=UPI0032047572